MENNETEKKNDESNAYCYFCRVPKLVFGLGMKSYRKYQKQINYLFIMFELIDVNSDLVFLIRKVKEAYDDNQYLNASDLLIYLVLIFSCFISGVAALYSRLKLKNCLDGYHETNKIVSQVQALQTTEENIYKILKRSRARVWMVYCLLVTLLIEDIPMLALNISLSFHGNVSRFSDFAYFVLVSSCIACVYKILFVLQLNTIKKSIVRLEHKIDLNLKIRFKGKKRRHTVIMNNESERLSFYHINAVFGIPESAIAPNSTIKKAFMHGQKIVEKYFCDDNMYSTESFIPSDLSCCQNKKVRSLALALRGACKLSTSDSCSVKKRHKLLLLLKQEKCAFHDIAYLGTEIKNELMAVGKTEYEIATYLNGWAKETAEGKLKKKYLVTQEDIKYAVLACTLCTRFKRFKRLKTLGNMKNIDDDGSVNVEKLVSEETLRKNIANVMCFLEGVNRKNLLETWEWDETWLGPDISKHLKRIRSVKTFSRRR